MRESTNWVGLDVHKDSITAAILYGDSNDVEIVQLPGEIHPVRRLFKRLEKRGPIRSCYEASSCGYALYRALDRDGYPCEVASEALATGRRSG